MDGYKFRLVYILVWCHHVSAGKNEKKKKSNGLYFGPSRSNDILKVSVTITEIEKQISFDAFQKKILSY